MPAAGGDSGRYENTIPLFKMYAIFGLFNYQRVC
jgi:hypothetical protein